MPKQNAEAPCKEITNMIPGFLADTLSDRDLSRFLTHVRRCRNCFAELETEFMVERAVSYLNQDLPFDTSFDMRPLLKERLETREKTLRHTRRIGMLRSWILFFTLVLIALLILDLTGLFHVTVFFAR